MIVNPDEPSPSMRNLRNEWFNRRRGDFAVFFVPRVRLTTNSAPSAADPAYDIVYIGIRQYSTGWEVAHELGHRLISPVHHGLRSSLMHPNESGDKIDEIECRAARGDAAAQYEVIRRTQ